MEKPLHKQTKGPFTLSVFYEDQPGQYRVVIAHNTDPDKSDTRFVNATWPPKFGIDADDMQEILRVAEEMSDDLEGKD